MLNRILNPKISALALDGEVDSTLELTSPVTRTSFKDQSVLCSVMCSKWTYQNPLGYEEYFWRGNVFLPSPATAQTPKKRILER